MQCCGAVKPINKLERNKVSCIYHVIDINARWLYVIYDDEMILRYQLNIKRPAGF